MRPHIIYDKVGMHELPISSKQNSSETVIVFKTKNDKLLGCIGNIRLKSDEGPKIVVYPLVYDEKHLYYRYDVNTSYSVHDVKTDDNKLISNIDEFGVVELLSNCEFNEFNKEHNIKLKGM